MREELFADCYTNCMYVGTILPNNWFVGLLHPFQRFDSMYIGTTDPSRQLVCMVATPVLNHNTNTRVDAMYAGTILPDNRFLPVILTLGLIQCM